MNSRVEADGKAVITGGAGFIGSNLAEELARRGHRLIILDDLSTGKKENIASLLGSGKVEFIQGSVTDLPLLQEIFQGVHFVFHLAAVSSVPRSIESPQLSHTVNATGTFNVLLTAKQSGVKKVIYASSSAVYGNSPVLPKREDMLAAPQTPYAATKLIGECYCFVFHQVYALPTVCLRYFNVYGPRQDPDSPYAAVIPRFIKMVGEGTPPIIFGDGEQTRDFTFVDDVVAASIHFAEGEVTGIFNIGKDQSTSINQLAELIMRLVGNRFEPIHQEAIPGEVRHSLADISEAKAFGYEPKHELEAGLAETIKWFNRGISS